MLLFQDENHNPPLVLSFAIMALITVLSIAGKAYADQAAKTFYAGVGAYDEDPITFLPVMDPISPIRERIFAPRTGDNPPAGSETGISPVSIRLGRKFSGQDVGADWEAYNFAAGAAILAEVGTGPKYEHPGTVAITSGTTVTITGATTARLNDISAVSIDGARREIASITSATVFELAIAHPGTPSGVKMQVLPVYTWAKPKLLRTGIISAKPAPHLSEKSLKFTIEDRDGPLSELATETWPGFGAAAYFRGAIGATGGVIDEAGDHTYGCRAYHSLEEAATVDQYLMDNGDKRIVIDLGVPRAEIVTSTGTHTVTGPAALDPESFYQLHVRFNLAAERMNLLIDGVQVASNASVDGTPTTSGNDWQLAKHVSAGSNYFHGVAGQFVWMDAYKTDDEAAEILAKPMTGAEDDVTDFLAGDINIATSKLIESSTAQAGSPDDFTLGGSEPADWLATSFLEGAAGDVVPLPIGPQRNLLATLVDAEQAIYRFARSFHDINDLFVAGESSTDVPAIPGAPARGDTVNTLQELLDSTSGVSALSGTPQFQQGEFKVTATSGAYDTEVDDGDQVRLDADNDWSTVRVVVGADALSLDFPYIGAGGSGAGSVRKFLYDVCPQLGCVRLARAAGGNLSGHLLGQGFGIRGRKYDGVDDFDSFGTNGNELFESDFEISFFLTLLDPDATQVLLDNRNLDGFLNLHGVRMTFANSGDGPRLAASIIPSSGSINDIVVRSGLLATNVTYLVIWHVSESGGDVTSTIYIDLNEGQTTTQADTLDSSVEMGDLRLGDTNGLVDGSQPFRGMLSDVLFLTGNRALATARQESYQPIAINRAGLAHYYPAYAEKIDGAGWFPTTLLVDEAEGISTALTGTVTFTTSSTAVSASGGAFTTEVKVGDVVRHPSDASKVRVATVTDNDNLVLVSNYLDTGGATAAGLRFRTLDGTMTGPGWVGGPSPSNALAQIEYCVRELPETGYVAAAFDITALYTAPTGAVSTFNHRRDSDLTVPLQITIRELISLIRANINAWDRFTAAGIYELGWIEDPELETAAITLEQPSIPGLHIGKGLPLPTEFRVRWDINRAAIDVSGRVSASRRREFETPFRWESAPSARNQDLVPTLFLNVLSSWVHQQDASDEKARRQMLYENNRPDLLLEVKDPGGVIDAGDVLDLVHEDMQGGVGTVLVFSRARAPSSDIVAVDAWGHVEEG